MVTGPKYPNRLRELIRQTGLTVKEVAEETGIPLRTLFDYCKGDVPIPRKKLEDLAAVIGYAPHSLVPPLPEKSLDLLQCTEGLATDWMHRGVLSTLDILRRDLLIQMGKLAATSSLSLAGPFEHILHPDAWERLLATLDRSARTDEATLLHLETLTDAYWSLYRTAIAKSDLVSSVSGHLMTVTRLLKTTQPVAVQYRLCSVVSNTAQILGEIYYDMDQLDHAQGYYTLAARAAQEVDNHVLQATALGREAFLPVTQGQPERALPLLREALTLAEGKITGHTRAWMTMMEAEALARMEGQKDACLSTLRKVDDLFYEQAPELEEAPNRDDRKWTGFSQPTLVGYKGTCYLYLHQPEEARSMLLITLETLPPGPTRRRSLLLSDLAISYIQSREIEEACSVATQALILTAQSKSPGSLQRLKNVRQSLAPWRNLACVRRFLNAMNMVNNA